MTEQLCTLRNGLRLCYRVTGEGQPLLHPSGGEAMAAAIKGARLITIRGMGHDLADGVIPKLVNHISEHAGRAA